jgi:hypothetical protein
LLAICILDKQLNAAARDKEQRVTGISLAEDWLSPSERAKTHVGFQHGEGVFTEAANKGDGG